MIYQYKCKIVKVIDGDTIDCDIDLGFDVILRNQRVRLEGIDTPESRTSDKEEKKYGKFAKKFVEDFLFNNDVFLITKEYDAKGKFGRILGDFYVNDMSLCESLLENHHAVRYNGQSKEDIAKDHVLNRKLLLEKMKK